ncbi:MAG: hypothetical protein ABI999_01080 [Acidobacteriota bacterium]
MKKLYKADRGHPFSGAVPVPPVSLSAYESRIVTATVHRLGRFHRVSLRDARK